LSESGKVFGFSLTNTGSPKIASTTPDYIAFTEYVSPSEQ